MTSSPPAEAPHYRGEPLSPASPIPLHIPEPSNIPVLQNQIDPIFNLMSTHLAQHSSSANADPSQHNFVMNFPPSDTVGDDIAFIIPGENLQDGQSPKSDGDDGYIMGLEKELSQEQASNDTLQNQSSSSVTQPTSTAAAFDTFSIPTQYELQLLPPSQSQKPTEEPVQQSPTPYEPPQDTPITPGLTTTTHVSPKESSTHVQNQDTDVNGGVNYQALLDNLSSPSATAPSAENIASVKIAAASEPPGAAHTSSIESVIANLPIPVGLPPRPPPQEKPAIHPNYTPGEDIKSYHYPHTQASNSSHTPYSSQPSNSYRPTQSYHHPAAGAVVGANGLPPPPLATFQQPTPKPGQLQRSPLTQQARQKDGSGKNTEKLAVALEGEDDEVPWDAEAERKYAQFLREEAIYVSEGLWDRFPPGSRLFVGNLYTEKVTKRDLFYKFHKHGDLAQVSIKNAYGFIQYLDAFCCSQALQAEQGQVIRGRKMHLEVSKPQKNARNATATAEGNCLRAGYTRSRSPDHGRGPPQRGNVQRPSIDRGVPSSSMPRRRDDYRPLRSPSPREFRGREEYRGGRERTPDRYYGGQRSRSRSPYSRNGRYRSRSPRNRELDDEASLPIPFRDPRDVPDVQLILLEDVDRTFVAYIEKYFHDRGLRCGTFQLPPRVSLDVVVKRQILEGVQAVVKIFRQSQVTGKIPLQVFDRSGGVDNIRFDEYDALDANIAAELVIRAKSTHLAPALNHGPGPQYIPSINYGVPQYGQVTQQGQPPQIMPPQQPPAVGPNPNLANLITSMDGPALQKLLGAMAQNPQAPQSAPNIQPQNPQQVPDLAALLVNVNRQQQQQQQQHHHNHHHQLPHHQQGYPYPPQQQQQLHHQNPNLYPPHAPNPSFPNNGLLGSGASNRPPPPPHQNMMNQQQPHQHPQQQQAMQPGHVQNIMEQLARWKQ